MKSDEKDNSAKESETRLLTSMYDAMLAEFGPRGWWPGRTRFEVCVGAILTQNTAWRNVRRAMANLRAAHVLNPRALHQLDHRQLADLIIPSGYFNVKANRLKNFTDFLMNEYGGSLNRLFKLPAFELREKLLSVNGIGRETADSILLYAAEKPVFVVDAYTRRIGMRHGLFPSEADYETIRMYFTERLPADVQLFNEYHALIVGVGNRFCSRVPKCDSCPLRIFLNK